MVYNKRVENIKNESHSWQVASKQVEDDEMRCWKSVEDAFLEDVTR